MDDLISRQAAIDFINAGRLVNPNEPRWSDNEVVAFLKSRPSAERRGRRMVEAEFKYKRGGRNTEAKQIFGTEWRTMQRLKCSVCGMVALVDDTIKYEYCPHCGTRMIDDCSTCPAAQNTNLEDDDSPCRDCEVE